MHWYAEVVHWHAIVVAAAQYLAQHGRPRHPAELAGLHRGRLSASGQLETFLEAFEPPALGIYAVLPSNRYMPHRVRVLIEFLSTRLAPRQP
ncbi:hypothetical protein NAV26_07320 [Pseudomonas stutzeri]|uniref:hypothetical protein n=1 Tax=Stutzerimonas stutzeri TaxID=316 RepID=UPI0015E05F6D|nr:hypothetical protein [Stutzerimonas stutzeri]MCQ4324772.1 hypothetical protein [Stutzerimonas stutzeri]